MREPALRRDLGIVESYAVLLGILIGAGIFRVTSEAWNLTGSSVILGYLVLAPAVLATSVGYSVFLSTPLGLEPGGEYTHISRTFSGSLVPFLGAWLKVISYLGALAYLGNAWADYVIELTPALRPEHRLALALGGLAFFCVVHVLGVRWFGRLQVAMGALLGVSLVVLILPGLLAIRPENYRPFFSHGAPGFAACLPPLFFAYAGFESLAQTAGEVKDSTKRLPRVFLAGITVTAGIFVLMSVVTFGVLPGTRLQASTTPMAEVAGMYLPAAAAAFVTLGAIMALTTSINATMLVPSRLWIILARDRLAPRWLGAIEPRTGTPVLGLALTLALTIMLLISGQMALALNIAVLALVILYFIHSLALLLLPRRNPELFSQVTTRIPPGIQRAAALISLVSMGMLILVQVFHDLRTIRDVSLAERISGQSLTSVELIVMWGILGIVMYGLTRPRRRS